MKVGINWIAPANLPIIQRLIAAGLVDFCEIMLDNFIHLPATDLKHALPDLPLSVHIVSSNFLHKTPAQLVALASHLRPWIEALAPLYISDHIPDFTAKEIPEKISQWQSLLGMRLYLENNASIDRLEHQQVTFFEKWLAQTGAGLLFDISNAHIAACHQITPMAAWQPLLNNVKHFHVAGFSIDETLQVCLDTHDRPLADSVINWMKTHTPPEDATIVVEFAANMNEEMCHQALTRVRSVWIS